MTTTRTIPIRRAALGAAALAAALGLAACGGGEPPLDTSVPANAAQRAVDEAGARATGPSRLKGEVEISSGVTGAFSIGLMGAVDPAGDSDVALDFGQAFDVLGLDEEDATVRVLVDEGDLYFRLPGFLAQELGSKEWIGVDADAPADAPGGSLIADLQRSSASTHLGYLRGALEDFVLVGEEPGPLGTLAHYRGTVDLRRAIERTPLAERPALREQVESLRRDSADGDLIATDVWLDAAGRVVRERMVFHVEVDGEVGTVETALEFVDHGTPVDAAAPNPSRVTPYAEVEDELAG
ncbi:MAG: hypothetical protein R3C15_15085 [Thermoleophilia bacterium]